MPDIYGGDAASMQFVTSAQAVAKEAAKHAADVDQKARFPEEAINALKSSGLMGLTVPANLGGKGQGPRPFVAVCEELAQSCASTAMIYNMHVVATQAIASAKASPSRDAVLKDIAAGKHLSTLALSEKGSRSNFWLPSSKLEPKGSGFVTNAAKSWVTSANKCDSFVSDGQKPGAASPLESTVYLARRGAGARVSGGFDGLGLRGNDSAPMSLENYEVKADDLLSEHGKGIDTMLMVILPWFSAGTAAIANGICRAAVGATSGHLSGTGMDSGSKLRDLPNLRARVAEMSMRTEQSRALLGYTLAMMMEPSDMTALYVLQTRWAALEAAQHVTDLAMKACGGAAFSRHLGVERLFRDARAGWVMAPTVDHLADFIGKAVTGLPLLG
jgi:alkylation response protein AidB-like acyl-CoA dehydrogenase